MQPMGKTELKLCNSEKISHGDGVRTEHSGYGDQGTSEHISPALIELLKSLVGTGNWAPAGA